MDSESRKTLRRIEQNDDEVTELCIGYSGNDGGFTSSDASDYARLGAAIGNNIHLEILTVVLDNEDPLDAASNEFFDDLKRNSSIKNLELVCCNQTLVGGVGHELFKSYQKINNNLTCIVIDHAILDNGGDRVIAETLRWCTNIKTINLSGNSITAEQLLPIVDVIKGGYNSSLEILYLDGNRIGNSGCHAIATLLAHSNCNIKLLSLETNQIGNEGATAIANSLANNTKLKGLCLRSNPFDPSAVGIFCTVLCNTSSINDTYRSNHTLVNLILSDEQKGQHANLLTSLQVNTYGTNTSNVAIKKILKYHPNIDMEPLFEWDAEGEQSLKALPYAIDWFGRAEEAIVGAFDREAYHVEEKKLSAIFQFAKAMPLLLVQPSNIKEESKKRKRIDT